VETKKIYRSNSNYVVAGVCGGVGEYFNIDPVIIRIAWVVLTFMGAGILAYLIAWIVIPKRRDGSLDTGQRQVGCLYVIVVFFVVTILVSAIGFFLLFLFNITMFPLNLLFNFLSF